MTNKQLKKFRKILILGYGVEGRCSARYIKKNCPDSQIIIADAKDNQDYLKEQNRADLVIKTPSINKKFVKKRYTTATNIFFANFKGVVVGVTGTKGKSTTAAMAHHILTKNGFTCRLCGNIGNPMLSELMISNTKKDIFIVELSSYQLDDCKYSPHIALVTNLFADHMTYHGNVNNYYNAKKNIILHQKPEDYFIYNGKNEILIKWAYDSKSKTMPVKNYFDSITKNSVLQNRYVKDNINAAFSVAEIFNISTKKSTQALADFQPLPHRMQYLAKIKGIFFYDDGAATTPQSAVLGIKTLKGKVGTIFLGGQDRGYNFQDLCRYLVHSNISNIVLFPDSGAKILSLLKKINKDKKFNILTTDKMQDAVDFAFKRTKKGRICLLSAASPSYSLWKNFSDKGNDFLKCINKYK